jgi:hypothetical protein
MLLMYWRPGLGVALFLALSCAAVAQERTGSLARNGAWEIGVWGAAGSGAELGGALGAAQISMAGIRLGRVVLGPIGEGKKRGTLEYTFDAIPVFVTTRPQVVYGGSFAPLGLKWNFDGNRRMHPYIEMSGGTVFTTQNVPPGRTANFNFTATAGPGVMIYTRPGQAITIALRYWHLSNAALGRANPSFNTVQVMLGYCWVK